MLKKGIYLALVAALGVGLTACGGDEASAPAGADTTAAGGAATAPAEGEVMEVVITPVGNEMRYATTEFTVRPGQQVRVVFENTATSPAMNHNVVVLTNEDAIDRVGQAALTAGEAQQYIPQDEAILAYTPMSKPGETVDVTFTAPSEVGDYPYICTFPGHYMLMRGTMKVAEQPTL